MFDIAVVGSPFVDFTFEGLPRLPRIGEEVTARALHVSPGGTGMQAIAAARLGLRTALVAPLSDGGEAAMVRSALAAEGVYLRPETPAVNGDRLPTTALLATPEGVAMATVLAGQEPRLEDVSDVGAHTVLLSLGRLHLAPRDGVVCAVTGALEVRDLHDAALEKIGRASAVITNAGEAASLTGYSDPGDAALVLARRVQTAIVTIGAEGAVAAENDALVKAAAPRVEVVDATGAGDLFAAAYVWAAQCEASLEDRLAWASLYAGLSVRAPTAFAGALRLGEFVDEGKARGLNLPPALNPG